MSEVAYADLWVGHDCIYRKPSTDRKRWAEYECVPIRMILGGEGAVIRLGKLAAHGGYKKEPPTITGELGVLVSSLRKRE